MMVGATSAAAAPAAGAAPGAGDASDGAPVDAFAQLLGLLLPTSDAPPMMASEAVEPVQPEAEAETDEDADPLIGWLFDSIQVARAPVTASPPPAVAASAAAVLQPLPTAQTMASGPELQTLDAAANAADLAEIADLQAALTEPMLADVAPTAPTAGADRAIADALAALSAPPSIRATNVTDATPLAEPQPPLHLADADMAADLGERIEWQLQQGIGEATLELHPAELGALTVRIETQGQQAQVLILAAEPAARALLQQSLPQLRDLLSQSGLSMTRGQVEAGERRGDRAAAASDVTETRRRISHVSLVDAYA